MLNFASGSVRGEDAGVWGKFVNKIGEVVMKLRQMDTTRFGIL